MPNDKSIRIGIDVDASDAVTDLGKVIDAADDAAEAVDELDKKEATLEVKVDTQVAEADLQKLDGSVTGLDQRKAEINVTVNATDALTDLGKAESAAKELDGRKTKVVVEADTSDATSKLDTLESKTSGVSKRVGESFVRDVGGVLDAQTAGPIADYVAAFETAGETIAGVGGPIGKIGSAIGGLATVLGIGGVAFVAAKSFWDMFKGTAAAAKREVAEIQAIQRQIAAGQTAAAAEAVVKKYGQAIDNAKQLGLTEQETTAFILGTTDSLGRFGSQLAITGDDLADTTTLQEQFNDLTYDQAAALADLLQPLYKARRGYEDSSDSLQTVQRRNLEALKAIGGTSDAFLELARTAVPEVREEILRYTASVDGIPDDVVTTLLTDSNPDDIAQYESLLDTATRDRTTKLLIDHAAADAALNALEAKIGRIARTASGLLAGSADALDRAASSSSTSGSAPTDRDFQKRNGAAPLTPIRGRS